MIWPFTIIKKNRISAYNVAYQKGFEDGVKASGKAALATATKVKSQWESQFSFFTKNSDDLPEVKIHDHHVLEYRDSNGMKVFHAKAVVGYFIVNPIADSYAYFDKD